ncbi:uncharacterized protein LOC119070280 [Bradysia coprophila]|uniref:uncharacterized protein LOC119070280 n=1 Tax=Bradysia coprophila TaxID=38358 RepID=UPI00187DA13B|nr:uncharacterized protein LOC119070280 [Bradysia coprophila]
MFVRQRQSIHLYHRKLNGMSSITQPTIIIINLLSTMVWCHPDALQLISRLNNFYRFDHNIFFMDPSIDLDDWFSMAWRSKLDNLTPQTLCTSGNLSTQTSATATAGKNTFLVVVIKGLTVERLQVLAHVRDIHAHVNVKIGVFFAGKITSLDIIERLFRWSWSAGIVNLFSAFQLSVEGSLNVFKYDPFGALTINVTNASQKLYPHRQSRLVIIVPHSQPFSGFVAYLRNGTWMLFSVYTFIVIVAASLLLIVSGYLRKNEFFLFECVTDVVNVLINDNAAIRYQNLCRADVLVIVPLTFAGFIAMNGILSVFQSYLTSPIYQPQINTIKDLHKSSVPILVNKAELKGLTYILEDLSKYGGWSDKFHGIQMDQLKKEIGTFNNSIAFFAFDYQAQALLEVQKRLSLKAFHLLRDTFLAKYPISFEIRLNFPFIEQINVIIHWLNDAGLINKWVEDSDEVKEMCKINISPPIKISGESDLGEFAVLTVMWCGWIASVMVFIGEVIWNKFKNHRLFDQRPD